jgi:hypothetical protein
VAKVGEDPTATTTADDRWQGRPVMSALVRTAVFVIPIALSILSATITAHLLPRPRGSGWTVGWWAVVLAVPTAVLFVTDRLARRLLPLAVLLKMTMVFPDQAPKRLAVARQAGNTRDLARRVEEAKTHGIEDEPILAAEKILALAGALNAHDRLTRGHGERVRALTDLIAEQLDLPTDDRDRLRWSALLHDIGKLAVHPHILNKPDKLNDEEWVVMKNHPLEGARLTAPLAGWLGPWASTVAEHHEKYDGSGYPYGLTGNEISLGGRIVAVADCYDTMTAVRSYKRAMSPAAARAELAACAGAQFDPKVVRAFLDVSIGRLRPVAGPLAWLGSFPFVSSVPRLGQVASALGRVGAATAVVGGAVTIGTQPRTNQVTVLRHGQEVSLPASPAKQASGTGGSAHYSQGTGTKDGKATGRAPGGTAAPPAGSAGTGTWTNSSSTATTVSGQGGGGSGGPGSGGSAPAGSGSSASGGAGSFPTTIPGTPATAPSAPTGVAGTAGNNQVTVSWSAPSNGGSAITSYTVTPYVGGVAQASHTFTSTATTQTVSGLADGTAYAFTVVATNSIGSSPPSAPSSPVTPVGGSLTIRNGGTAAGHAEENDQVIASFARAPNVSSFCSAWSAGAYPDLVGPNVVVHGSQPSSGDDTVTVTDTADCSGGFHFGTIDMGQRGYFSGTAITFGGASLLCNGLLNLSGCARIHWDGARTLTITLGQPSSTQPTQPATSVAIYTPDPTLGLLGTINSVREENF